MIKEYKWICITEVKKSPSGKTSVFEVSNKIYGSILGTIKWNCGWRCYAFYPIEETYFEQDCLRNISEFLDDLKEKEQ